MLPPFPGSTTTQDNSPIPASPGGLPPFPGSTAAPTTPTPAAPTQRFTLSPVSTKAPTITSFEAPKTAQSSSQKVSPFPADLQSTVDSIKFDPFSVKDNIIAHPIAAAKDIWKNIEEPFTQEIQNIKDYYHANSFESADPAKNLGAGLKVVTGGVGLVFTPITALFKTAEHIPILGTAVKAFVNLPFQAAGDVGKGVANELVDKLPISDESKKYIGEGLGEVFALGAQLALGESIGGEKVKSLEEKYGKTDAKTIVDQATEMAKEKKANIESASIQGEVSAVPSAEPIPQFPKEDILYHGTDQTNFDKIMSEGFKVDKIPRKNELSGLPANYGDAIYLSGDTSVAEGFGSMKSTIEHLNEQLKIYRRETLSNNSDYNGVQDIMEQVGRKEDFPGLGKYLKSQKIDAYGEKMSLYDAVDQGLIDDKQFFKEVKKFIDTSFKTSEAKIIRSRISPDANLFEGSRQEEINMVSDAINKYPKLSRGEAVKKFLTSQGYDGLISTADKGIGKQHVIYNPDIIEIIKNSPKTETSKTSGVASSIEAKAIEQGLINKGFDKLAQFEGTTFEEQSRLSSDMIKNDLERAKRIVRGEEPIPSEMRSAALISALEDYAKQSKDVGLMYDLANSGLASKISESASELSLTRMREKDSATMKLEEIRKERQVRAEKRIPESTRKVVKEAAKETEKVNLPKEDLIWDKFLDGIKC